MILELYPYVNNNFKQYPYLYTYIVLHTHEMEYSIKIRSLFRLANALSCDPFAKKQKIDQICILVFLLKIEFKTLRTVW